MIRTVFGKLDDNNQKEDIDQWIMKMTVITMYYFRFLSGEQTFDTKLNWRKNICFLLIDGSINTQKPF